MNVKHVAQISDDLLTRIPNFAASENRLLNFQRSCRTLGEMVSKGELWWAPRPLKEYRSESGLDLNLAVLVDRNRNGCVCEQKTNANECRTQQDCNAQGCSNGNKILSFLQELSLNFVSITHTLSSGPIH